MSKPTEKEILAMIERTKKTLLDVKARQDKLIDGASKIKEIKDLKSQIKQLKQILKTINKK